MPSPLFSPVTVGNLDLPNRVFVAPMCQYSAQNGTANEWHRVHLGTLARSGAGLLTVEATAPEARGRITHSCLGLYSDENESALAGVLRTVRAVSDVKLSIQIGHAGRKASTQRPWEGRGPLGPDEAPWETLSPSGISFTDKGPATRQMSQTDMDDVIAAHVQAAQRAARLGFDMLEIHSAHGYLLASFLSPLSNTRTDAYGGSIENRMRFPLAVVEAVRAAWPSERPMSIKINGTDWADGGVSEDDVVRYAAALADAGIDLIVVSGGGVVPGGRVPVGPGYQLPAARRIKAAGVPATIASVGMYYDPHFANSVIGDGHADAISIARAFLFNPRWAYHAAAALGDDVPYPPQYERAGPGNWGPALEGPPFQHG